MNKITLVLFIIAICYCPEILGQVVISGVIYEKTNTALPGANITVDNGQGTSSDMLGRFKLILKPGDYAITASHIGYESLQINVKVGSEPVDNVDFHLTPGEIELSDVVVTTEEARSLKRISAYDIKLRPTGSSQDVLRLVPGLFIAQHAGGGKAEQIFLRGFDIDHGTDIALSVDGLPVNMVSHAHGQGYSDLHFLIPETIESVNFNKGPYYAEQGNFNTAGYAAFQTLTRLDNSMVKVEGGQYGTLRAVTMLDVLNRQVAGNREHLYLASEINLTDGYFDSNQNFSRINFMAKYAGYLGNDRLLKIVASNFSSQWDASGQIPQRAINSGQIGRFGAIDDTEGGKTGRTNLNLQYVSSLPNDAILSHQMFFTRYDFKLVSNFTFFLNDPVHGDQITQSENRYIYGYNGTFEKEGQLKGAKIKSEVGAGFRFDDIEDIRLSHTLNRKEVLEDLARGDISEVNLYGYVSETLHPAADLAINASLRYDYFMFSYVDALSTAYERQTERKGAVSPKLSINYRLTPAATLFVKGGLGFHSNDTRVVVAREGRDILPKAYGLDVGGIFKPAPNIAVNIALWQLHLDQEFVYVGDEGIVEPSGKTRRKGVDLSIRYQLLKWLYLDTDINYTDPEAVDEPEGANYIPLAPTFTSIGGLSVRFANGINGSLRYRYLDDRPANEDNSVVAKGYFLLDAVVNYRQPKYEIGISVVNLLNRKWKEAQFDTESRLYNETTAVSEIHFTPGSPFFFKGSISYFF
ncbi:outer membrane receptor protein [Fulvivirga imtechensis AK7]|uniref:Outer membrane receptor protein n=1 Tax=Fulvivirga imtechensis AK7 TaxID=1237149 RepID=L8K0I7_9BACT|nr:TonB-dependent receptor [Fulvivirga imtechensis]ELR72992.1 outer membrane receptor protein [Fulvivirga imtechensis AK7]